MKRKKENKNKKEAIEKYIEKVQRRERNNKYFKTEIYEPENII